MLLSWQTALAQQASYHYLGGAMPAIDKPVNLYIGATHQHQNFFGKPFSFQGLEMGSVMQHHFLLGGYGATFASTLATERGNAPLFVYMNQAGLLVGVSQDNRAIIHGGGLLNLGYFSLTGNNQDFNLLHPGSPSIRLSGLVVSPQVYGELNLTRWMRFRTGLTYTFYSYTDQSIINPSDLQNVSLTFGFIVGKFVR
ncbi:hypothetical protein GCM10028809_33900 [Spirosoma gilvum]